MTLILLHLTAIILALTIAIIISESVRREEDRLDILKNAQPVRHTHMSRSVNEPNTPRRRKTDEQ